MVCYICILWLSICGLWLKLHIETIDPKKTKKPEQFLILAFYLIPVKCATGLVLCHFRFEEIFLFLHIRLFI
jgi:hypothetical protein